MKEYIYDSICLKFKTRKKNYSGCVLIKNIIEKQGSDDYKVRTVAYLWGKKEVATGTRHTEGSWGTANILFLDLGSGDADVNY